MLTGITEEEIVSTDDTLVSNLEIASTVGTDDTDSGVWSEESIRSGRGDAISNGSEISNDATRSGLDDDRCGRCKLSY